jgi:FHS family glucose/mannose:H+ symporter-like MFS transporter
MSNSNQVNNLPLKISLHLSFFIVGIVTVLFGQIMPILAKDLELNDQQAGFFATSQFYGSIIGTVSTAFLIRKIGFVKTLGIGFLLFVIGMGGLNLGGYQVSWLSVCVYGIGFGLAIPSTLMLTAALSPVRTASALNLMSFAWGLGAIASQPVVSYLGGHSFTLPTLLLLGISVIFTLTYFFVFTEPSGESQVSPIDAAPSSPIWSNPKAWLIVAFGLFDVGIESGISNWLTTYTLRSNLPAEISTLSATPIFFMFFVLGRGLAAVLARFLSNNQIIWASLTLTLLGTILLILSTGWQTIFFSSAVLGLGLAAVFPTNMARFTETFGPEANAQTVPLFVMGSVGSITITWLIGYFSTAYNSLNAGLGVLLGAAILLIVLQTLFQNRPKLN